MNWIDILVIVPILFGLYKGFKKGLVIEIASLVALFLGIYGAVNFSGPMAKWLSGSFSFNQEYLPVIAFAVTFLLIVIAVYTIAKLVEKLIKAVALGTVNRILGASFGAIKLALIVSIAVVITSQVDSKIGFIQPELKEGSLLYKPMEKLAPALIPGFEKLSNDNILTVDSSL